MKTRPWQEYREYPQDEMLARARDYAEDMQRRRTVRDYDSRPVAREIIEQALRAAASAPSGANRQPWHFVVVSDPRVKHAIRIAAEKEEREFYSRRAPPEWLTALEPLGTDADKPFLDIAPYLIAVFYERYGLNPDGSRYKTYYSTESVGLACGLLISTLHRAGLATLTHTPSPMKFLREILGRPINESPYLLLVTGYPAAGCEVPDIQRKPLDEVVTWVDAETDT